MEAASKPNLEVISKRLKVSSAKQQQSPCHTKTA